MTRESILDIISTNLSTILEGPDSKYAEILLDSIVERADLEENMNVRKRVIQILSQVLNNKNSPISKTKTIRILILKWKDASLGVRGSLVSSIQKILKTSTKS
jgi:hypothetical protein